MDKNLLRVRREVLNTFDLLGNVGGVQGLLASIAVTLLSIFNFQKPENRLVSNLYTVKRSKNDDKSEEVEKEKTFSASS